MTWLTCMWPLPRCRGLAVRATRCACTAHAAAVVLACLTTACHPCGTGTGKTLLARAIASVSGKRVIRGVEAWSLLLTFIVIIIAAGTGPQASCHGGLWLQPAGGLAIEPPLLGRGLLLIVIAEARGPDCQVELLWQLAERVAWPAASFCACGHVLWECLPGLLHGR
jgi:hypothetical protein